MATLVAVTAPKVGALRVQSSTSFFEAKFTFAETSPVAGLNTSEVLFEVPEKDFPLTKCSIIFI